MQAIVTKYIGPTDTKCSRVKAFCLTNTKGVTISWDSELTSDQNHAAAAEAFKEKMLWTGYPKTVMGALPDGSVAHVFMPRVG
jgi:hypothetical protein